MTVVHVDLRIPQSDGSMSGGPLDGKLTISLLRRERSGSFYVLPTSFDVPLVDGQADVTLNANYPDNAWTVKEGVPNGITRTVQVPDSPTPVNYVDLVDVDPGSLNPSAGSVAAWDAAVLQVRSYAQAAATSAQAAEDASSAAFDMFPTPIADCNDATDGFSIAQSGAANRPAGAQTASLILLTLHYSGFGTPYVFQTATREDTAQVFGRFMYGSTWYPWQTDHKFDTSGGLDMNGAFIYGLHDPGSDQDAATKKYVDAAISGASAWSSLSATDLNDAPDGVVFLDSGAPPANSPAGGALDGQVATITKIVPFGDPVEQVPWRIQSAECVAFDGSGARSFLREQWQGVWTAWAEVGPAPFSAVPAIANWDDAPDGVRLLDGSMQNMVGAPLPGFQMDGFITTVTYGLPGQTVAEWRFQTAMGLPWDNSAVRYLARSKFGGVWTAWSEIGGETHFDANGYLNMANKGITWVLDPTDPQDAATKAYVDSRSVALTQAAYDALATKDPNTLYLITG